MSGAGSPHVNSPPAKVNALWLAPPLMSNRKSESTSRMSSDSSSKADRQSGRPRTSRR